ncbi:MAG TPA: V-type ATP synthase subunit D [Candidatus Sulfotelmatobacter sp.]|nr:V-type ATP synthase subunit D [Candidatus Sulfotelmatobacter sp.]
MARLNVAPTKSNLLQLRRQLAFAEEGYDLLEQKRQLLVFELMSRLERARAAESAVATALPPAFAALREALLDNGSEGLDRAALGVQLNHQITLSHQHLMGLRLPQVQMQTEAPGVQFGLSGTSAHTDETMHRVVVLLPLLGELAELQTSMARLARELRKTQRRCNALSKLFIPDYRETISYILGALEERERESFVILKMIRNRLAEQVEPGQAQEPAG